MRQIFLTAILGILILGGTQQASAQDKVPSSEAQILAAVSPAPADMRDGAAVLGYDENGELVLLRKGSNKLICLADDPVREQFHVACYFKELEPFMERGRELRKEGKTTEEVREIRRREIEAGNLPWPQKPMALYSLTGPDNGFDYSSEQLLEASPLYVVYIPYATEESTGIASKPPSRGAPWLMDAGKPWAHIMISTGRMLGEDYSENGGQ